MKFKKDISTIGEQCTGCGACSAICPLGCIQMKVDAEGFRMPEIDHTVYLNCGKCVKICPAYNDTIQYDPVRVLAAASYDEEGCQRSSSGGVFYEAARYVIQSLHGYVCGAVLDDDLQLKHIVTDSMRDVVKMQGSKYIQSDITGCYSEIQNHLKKHQVVLFCGTPCQVAGIEHFLGKTNGLVTMDLICHGTPSAYAFSEYMHKKYPEEKYFDFSFRQKNIHTKSLFSYHYFSKNKKGNMKIAKRVLSSQDPFYQAFLNGDNYRESCYICKYAKDSRCGDITIGDCANYRAYELPLNKELSTVCINTENGEKMWNAI